MPTKTTTRIPLLRYWTIRYLITLFIGLGAIGLLAVGFIKNHAAERRLDLMSLVAEDMAENPGNTRLGELLAKRQGFLGLEDELITLIINENGTVAASRPPYVTTELASAVSREVRNGKEKTKITISGPIPRSGKGRGLHGPEGRGSRFFGNRADKFDGPDRSGPTTLFMVARKLNNSEKAVAGWVVLLHPERELQRSPEELQFLSVMLLGLGLLGWGVIYYLTRRLSQPIRDVANAAKHILAKDYDVKLNHEPHELEVYELVTSFQEMADRLKGLEAMRTELLAGVTHELKTPVASLAGLLGALRDGVVTGDEAGAFYEAAVAETKKMQGLVEDLLEFNSFSVGAVKVTPDSVEVNGLIKEIVHQWELAQGVKAPAMKLEPMDHEQVIETDPLRVQQIIVNLLNNASQAMRDKGTISVEVVRVDNSVHIDVCDDGPGVPSDEQSYIFERFFRGRDKKHRVRGLGLGLPFSRLMSRALRGDLVLLTSEPGRTIFRLTLPTLEKNR